ncbi:MAG: ABC transporter ATP-binding protein [Coleofasciculus sp. C2-GNP5-27]
MIAECINVAKVFLYPKQNRGIFVLRNINLRIHAHEFICLLGPSGCGKTTLLQMMAGFEQPTQGQIVINQRQVNKPSPDIGVVFQEFSLYPWKTVFGNVELGLKAQGISQRKRQRIVRKYLHLVGLEGFESARPHQLSGGMKQKVAIARALALDPDILLMDEPFSSLDEQTKHYLDFELLKIWQSERKTIVFVTHSLEEAIVLADRIIVLTKRPGKIKQEITIDLPRPRDIFSAEALAVRKELLANLT